MAMFGREQPLVSVKTFQNHIKIGTKSIRSIVPQVDVGGTDDAASFDDPRAVKCHVLRKHKNYFTSCDPHHDIYTCSYWQIFWHSI